MLKSAGMVKKAAQKDARPRSQLDAYRSLSGVWIRERKKPLGGLSHHCLPASAQETPAALRLASPGKRTRRKRRVRPVVCLRLAPWQPMTGLWRIQGRPQTDPDDRDQTPQPGFLHNLRVDNIVVSY